MNTSDIQPSSRLTPGSVLKKYFLFYIIVALVGGSFYGGVLYGKDEPYRPPSVASASSGAVLNANKPIPDYVTKNVDFNLFWTIWKKVKEEYFIKNTPDTTLFYGAVSGIVSSLGDPYSVFFNPQQAKQFDESLTGSFDGIGAELGMKNNQLLIIATLPGMPAEKAGLRAGDEILAVDKKKTTGMSIDEAVSRIRGKSGTAVKLTIYHEGEAQQRDVAIVRGTIQLQSVQWSVKQGNIGYIQIIQFSQDTSAKFKQAVDELLAKHVKGIVVDLRNDPGGYLDAAVDIAGYWVGGNTVVMEKYADGKQDEFKGHEAPRLSSIPTAVLINKGSASASEIVSGALQDDKKAVLIGEQSYGKGSVQDVQRLPDGSELKLTIAHWLTPKGRTIQDQGITPDIPVQISDSDYKNKKDPQLDRAFSEIKKEIK